MASGRQLLSALGVQGAGLAALAVANILIARRTGVEGQAFFSNLRAVVDFAVVIGLFGFPQSIAFWVARYPGNGRALVLLSLLYSLLLLPLSLLGLWGGSASGIQFLQTLSPRQLLLCGLCVSALVIQGLARGIALPTCSTWRFSLVSSSWQFSVLLLLLAFRVSETNTLLYVLLGSSLIAACFSAACVGIAAHGGGDLRRIPVGEFVRFGTWSFVSMALLALQPVITFEILGRFLGAKAVGLFGVSVFFLSVVSAPLAVIGPVLYGSWTKTASSDAQLSQLSRLARAGFLCYVPVVIMVWFFVGKATNLIFGQLFMESCPATFILMLGFVFVYCGRLVTAMLSALGSPVDVALGNAARTGLTTISMILLPAISLESVAVCWSLGEFAGCVLLTSLLVRKTGWSLWRVVGVR